MNNGGYGSLLPFSFFFAFFQKRLFFSLFFLVTYDGRIDSNLERHIQKTVVLLAYEYECVSAFFFVLPLGDFAHHVGRYSHSTYLLLIKVDIIKFQQYDSRPILG
jgi:hypothetical protein